MVVSPFDQTSSYIGTDLLVKAQEQEAVIKGVLAVIDDD